MTRVHSEPHCERERDTAAWTNATHIGIVGIDALTCRDLVAVLLVVEDKRSE